jgi:hypothetical protein
VAELFQRVFSNISFFKFMDWQRQNARHIQGHVAVAYNDGAPT